MESSQRFFRRRATEELSAASRCVTQAARERRIQLGRSFCSYLDNDDAREILSGFGLKVQSRSHPEARAAANA